MADNKISLLNPATLPLLGTEKIPLVQDGETRNVDASELKSVLKFRITQNLASATLINVNTWRGWNKNTSNMITSDANTSYGTGATPTKIGTWYGDSNVIFLKDLKRLTKLTFHAREGSSVATMQLYVLVADYGSRGSEPNGVEIINENINITTGSVLKDNFTIATHNLSANSILQVFYRQSSGATPVLQGVQLIWEFEQ